MKFEVIRSDGLVAMVTEHLSCIPKEPLLTSMTKSGYKFKLNEKTVSKKKVLEFLKEERCN